MIQKKDFSQIKKPSDLPSAAASQTFRLYAAQGRVYASNVRMKLVDLGELVEQGGRFRYELDGDHLKGQDFISADSALVDIGKRLSFLYLDGQFTALADVRGPDGPNLDNAPQNEIRLDELGKGERAFDTTV